MEKVILVLYYFGFRRLASELLRRLGKSTDSLEVTAILWYGSRLWEFVSLVRVLIPTLIVVGLLIWLESSIEAYGLTAITIPIVTFGFQVSLGLRPFNLKEFVVVQQTALMLWLVLAAVPIFHLELSLSR